MISVSPDISKIVRKTRFTGVSLIIPDTFHSVALPGKEVRALIKNKPNIPIRGDNSWWLAVSTTVHLFFF